MSKYLLVGLLLLGCPAMADEPINDGPVAIRPLTVGPKGYPTHPPITILPKVQPAPVRLVVPYKVASTDKICDFQNQCYPVNPSPKRVEPSHTPVIANNRPIISEPNVVNADSPSVIAWKNCMSQALGRYYQTHDQHELQMSAEICQGGLGRITSNYPTVHLNEPNIGNGTGNGRRDIGCGWWPIGSDADRDCASGRFNGNNELE